MKLANSYLKNWARIMSRSPGSAGMEDFLWDMFWGNPCIACCHRNALQNDVATFAGHEFRFLEKPNRIAKNRFKKWQTCWTLLSTRMFWIKDFFDGLPKAVKMPHEVRFHVGSVFWLEYRPNLFQKMASKQLFTPPNKKKVFKLHSDESRCLATPKRWFSQEPMIKPK